MADINNRYKDNVKGNLFVDNDCIDCDLCQQIAPDNFARNENESHSYVFKQPTTLEEKTKCKEAEESCPVNAIGS